MTKNELEKEGISIDIVVPNFDSFIERIQETCILLRRLLFYQRLPTRLPSRIKKAVWYLPIRMLPRLSIEDLEN